MRYGLLAVQHGQQTSVHHHYAQAGLIPDAEILYI
jgi:hypothetical protein